MIDMAFAYRRSDEFAGQVALVTGSSRNIGRSIAESMAAGGAKVAVHGRVALEEAQAVAQTIRDAGGDAEAYLADHVDKEQIESFVVAVLQRFGRIDHLILNAAIREPATLTDATWEEWRRVLAIDLDSAFIYTKACLPSMIANGGGNIVTFGGANALSGAGTRVHVTSAKYGMIGFTKAAANDLAQYNIRVNMVSPGSIADDGVDPGQGGGGRLGRIPLGRQGVSEEIATVVRFLCGPGGSYISGQTLHVNGGLVMY